jgi:hypothetical protein
LILLVDFQLIINDSLWSKGWGKSGIDLESANQKIMTNEYVSVSTALATGSLGSWNV